MIPKSTPAFPSIFTLAAALIAGPAPAADECGPLEPGVELACTAENYDAADDGNIFYAEDVPQGNVSVRLEDGLEMAFDRDVPGDDVFLGDFDPHGLLRHNAVTLVPVDPAHAGDIALTSSAEVIASGERVRGYLVGRFGGTGDVRLGLRGGSVTTRGSGSVGVSAIMEGDSGNLGVSLDGAAVRAHGASSNGVWGRHTGAGDLLVDARATTVTAMGEDTRGLFADHVVSGESRLTVRGGAVTVSGDRAKALSGYRGGEGDMAFVLRDTAVMANGTLSRALAVDQFGSGDMLLDFKGARIEATGDLQPRAIEQRHYSEGDMQLVAERSDVRARGAYAQAIFLQQLGHGEITIDLSAESTIHSDAEGGQGAGIFAAQEGTGNIVIRSAGGSISAVGGELTSGVVAQYYNDAVGDIVVDIEDTIVTSEAERAQGVRAGHFGYRGDIMLRLRDASVAVAGLNAAGVEASLVFGRGSVRVHVAGGDVIAEGNGADGVKVGFLNDKGRVFAAGVGADGFRDQTVTVNGRVHGGSGDGAGIWLAGGGRVEMGPEGRVGADSGAAVRAVGEGAALHVSADFAGRGAADVFDGEIRNDAGRTTIVVDGVTLHDGAHGATGALIPRGARDLTLLADDAVLGRAFSAADFAEPLAPRAAVYETLPDFLFRLAAPAGGRLSPRVSGGHAGLDYGTGSIEAAGTSTGAGYDFERSTAVLALSGSLGARFGAWIELHHGDGAADIASPAGAGSLDALFTGYRAGATLQGSRWYARAGIASEDYLLDVATARRGLLGAGIDANARSFGVELGRTVPSREGTALTPRAWFTHAEVSASSFTDAVNAAVSLPVTDRTMGGVGVDMRFTRNLNGDGAVTVGGFVDVESLSGDTRTLVHVSGEALTFDVSTQSVSAGLNLNYRRGRLSLDAAAFARAAQDTGATEHGARLYLGGLF